MPLTNVEKPILMIPDDELPRTRRRSAPSPIGTTRGYYYPDPPLRPEIRLSSPRTHAWVGRWYGGGCVVRADYGPMRIRRPGPRR